MKEKEHTKCINTTCHTKLQWQDERVLCSVQHKTRLVSTASQAKKKKKKKKLVVTSLRKKKKQW